MAIKSINNFGGTFTKWFLFFKHTSAYSQFSGAFVLSHNVICKVSEKYFKQSCTGQLEKKTKYHDDIISNTTKIVIVSSVLRQIVCTVETGQAITEHY